MAELLDILETLRTPSDSFAGKRLTLRNARLFVALYVIVLILVSATSAYVFMISEDLQNRFFFPQYEMKFIYGADKLTVVFTTLFVGYFGNRIHKPLALSGCSVVFAFGAILMAVAYWSLRENANVNAQAIETFTEAGLCFHGVPLPGQNASRVDNDRFSFGLQCTYDIERDSRGAFTLFCVAQLLMGFARPFILVLGIVFAVETERGTETDLYIGKTHNFVISYMYSSHNLTLPVLQVAFSAHSVSVKSWELCLVFGFCPTTKRCQVNYKCIDVSFLE